MALTVTDLVCSRGGRRIVDGLGFVLADGELLVLRGPNGAGKSTLLRALAGLLPAEGSVVLDGIARAEDPDGVAVRLAYVGHQDAVKPALTVAENLGFWAAFLGGDARAGIEAFGLGALSDQPAHLCSAGQKRRLGLARLAVAPRRLWLLDEPTVSLDATAEALLMAALARHRAAGGCAVVATHATLDAPGARELRLDPRRTDGGRAPGGDDPFLGGAWT